MHCRIVAEEVLGGDPVDFGIIEDGSKRGPEPFDVPGFRSDEHIAVFRESSETMEVESDRAKNDVANTEALEGPDNLAEGIEIHRTDSTDPSTVQRNG